MTSTARESAKVTAVIVTYQSAQNIGEGLAAVRRCYDAGQMLCIVVDNGSNDGTQELLRDEASWVDVALTGKNNGFGRGCNIGLEQVQTEYTMFLNPDATIGPEALKVLVDFMDTHPKAGVCGPATIVGAEGAEVQYQAAGRRPSALDIVRQVIPRMGRADLRQVIQPNSVPFRTGWVCGAVFLVRTELMKRISGFDPRFFLYWEETDVCRRMEDLGYEVWAVGTAIAHHVGSASSPDDDSKVHGCIAEHYYQSRRYYLIKHHGWLAATLAELIEFSLLCVRAIVHLVRGQGIGRLKSRLKSRLFTEPPSSF